LFLYFHNLSKNLPKSDVNRTITTNLCGWSEQNAFDSVCLKPAFRTTGPNVMGGVGCGKPERFSYQKPTRTGKQYKFYHYDDPHAYILQYRRDCTLNSSSKDHNQDKGPIEELNKSIVVEMDTKNYNHSEKSDISQINNQSFSEQSHLQSKCTTTTTSNFQPQLSEMKVKSTKSTLNSTTTTTTTVSGNRHLWVNNCPTGPGRNNHMNKVSNADTSQSTSGKFSDKTDMNSNGSNQIPALRIKSATKLNVESTTYITNIQQSIRDANHPEFWPLLYKKLIHLQAERANQIEEEK
uniref:NAM domain-containing protein n=1 Tax=Schistosoma curassoni TaxID=6186 RepID=A0A183KDA2_9TREM